MAELPLTGKQIGIILFWGGFAWWAFRMAWRYSKDVEEHRKKDRNGE